MTPGNRTTAHPDRHPVLFALVLLLLLPVPASLFGAPRFEASWSRNPVRPGGSVELIVTARWEGDAGLYAVRPPRPDPPEGLTPGAVSSRSFQEGAENVVRFRQAFVAAGPGSIPAFSVAVQVFREGQEAPLDASVETEPLRVDSPRWWGVPLALVLPCSAALAILLAATALWICKRRRRRRRDPGPPARPDPGAALSALREKLDACRVKGDTPGFFETALEIHRLAGDAETPESREVRERAEQARYGDLRLSGEEMDAWARRLKRARGARPPEQAPPKTEGR